MMYLTSALTRALSAPAVVPLPPALAKTDHSLFSPIAKPIADVLAAFYSLIPNYGVAIILLSLAWMIIIAPLTLKSTRSMLAMQKLQPQLKRLQAEHKNDRQAFTQAQMQLFKDHNVSPFGSCLPTLLPLPVFFALFRVIDGLSHHVVYQGHSYAVPSFLSPHTAMFKSIQAAGGHINAFGLDLSKNALSGHSSFAAALPFYILLLIMIGTQYLQTVQMMSRNPAANDNPQMKMMKYLPLVFGVVCVRFPAGVILYYGMSNICRISQQTAMYRYDPKVKALVRQEVVEVEAITRDIDRRNGSASATTARDDSSPARGGRFRDALAQATRQASEGRDRKTVGTKLGGAATSKSGTPASGAVSASSKARPAGTRPKGQATKGQTSQGQPVKGQTSRGQTSNGRATNGATANGRSDSGQPANSQGRTGQRQAKRQGSPGPDAKGAVGAGAGNGATALPGTQRPSNGSNGAGVAPDAAARPAASRTGAGRTGASEPRTPKKPRSR